MIQFNSIISEAFPLYNFYPSILKPTQSNGRWDLSLPDIKDASGIVLHTQDNLNVAYNNIVPEIVAIEDYYVNANINDIVLIHWNHNLKDIYSGELKLIEFPTHSFDFVQSFSNRYNEWKNVEQKTNSIKFMCLNGRPRNHRILVYDYISSLGINSFVSIYDTNNDNDISYGNYDFDNVNNFIKLIDLYKKAPVNVVTETLYYESRGILTEKLLQAFGALQIPIIIGHRGAVEDARRYGFDMFDDIVDNSFDNMSNDIRWREAIDLNKHILRNEFNYEDLLPRLKKNQEYLLNGYLNFILDKFQTQVNEMFSRKNENPRIK